MKILIADDHPLYREALRAQIERLFPGATVDEVTSFGEVTSLVKEAAQSYALYLLDFGMPQMSIPALKALVQALPQIPIAVISGTANTADVRAVIQAGARGFIPKTATGEHLGHALNLLLAGGTSVPTEILLSNDESSAGLAAPAWLPTLSARELEVLKGVARGLSNKEIARELGLAEVTVKLHLRGVFRKLGARSRSEAAVAATKANIA